MPEPGKQIGKFCDVVMGLEWKTPTFLGVVFFQVDPDLESTSPYKFASFVVPFVSGPDAEARLLFAQREEASKIRAAVEGLRK